MPLYDFLCLDCNTTSELLIISSDEAPRCESCGSSKVRKLLAPHSSMSGAQAQRLPGAGDTSCCGTTPSMAGCAGPGSCCGKA